MPVMANPTAGAIARYRAAVGLGSRRVNPVASGEPPSERTSSAPEGYARPAVAAAAWRAESEWLSNDH
jgi:hypothetical protein